MALRVAIATVRRALHRHRAHHTVLAAHHARQAAVIAVAAAVHRVAVAVTVAVVAAAAVRLEATTAVAAPQHAADSKPTGGLTLH